MRERRGGGVGDRRVVVGVVGAEWVGLDVKI